MKELCQLYRQVGEQLGVLSQVADQTYLLAKKAEDEVTKMGFQDEEIVSISSNLNALSHQVAVVEEKIYEHLITLKVNKR
ncbi:hypothetical protein F9B85_11000 [Heliorestis acidaminivorans]|uniref:Uncharacterized protein n=1 Tax=Heliorestis acidaminivorans TaxID=553427 RepID=A0A6I0F3S9_9FIRM|nr:hypothetical protein [Heliorestis acidaminivorans]KAB2951811.1 hypothetical protein F9B85_11000 [Heliorestis acidaminivorans]